MNQKIVILLSVLFVVSSGFSFMVTLQKKEPAVYVFTGGSGTQDGSSPENALPTLTAAYQAVSTGGVIVVCGTLDITESSFAAPATGGRVLITSLYKGVDYRESSNAIVNLSKNYSMQGDTVFENLDIRVLANYPMFSGQYHDITFGNGITCTLGAGVTEYPILIGGYNLSSTSSEVQSSSAPSCLTVNSGIWEYVRGGNRRGATSVAVGHMYAETRLIINGGTFMANADSSNIVTAGGMNYNSGSMYMEINGGTFHCPVYGLCRRGGISDSTDLAEALYSGNLLVRISGGTFLSTVGAVQEPPETPFVGDCTLVITGGSWSEPLSAGGVRGSCVLKYDPGTVSSGFKDLTSSFALTVPFDENNPDTTSEYIDAQFNNPITTGADPWMVQRDGFYYYCYSIGTGVKVAQCGNIPLIDRINNSRIVYSAPGGTLYSSQYWAPELHFFDAATVGTENAGWYIYVAASDGSDSNHRMYVLRASDPEDPQSAFSLIGSISDPSDDWAIDGTVLTWAGELYFVWSGRESRDLGDPQNLYIAHMSDPWTIDSERTLISSPEYNWERQGTVNEAPQALIHDDTLYLVYSASGSWTRYYCLGLLTYDGSGSLLDASSWSKTPEPVFSSAEKAYGPGHCCFVSSVDGQEDWILYHANYELNPEGTWWSARTVRTQSFAWNTDGTPSFGTPVDPDITMTIQAENGEALKALRYDPEGEGIVAVTALSYFTSTSVNELYPEYVVNGAGLNSDHTHVNYWTKPITFWSCAAGDSQDAWIQFEFDQAYELAELWVWNYNQGNNTDVGMKDVIISYSVDGQNFTEVEACQFARADGTSRYAHNTEIDLGGICARYVKVTAVHGSGNWGDPNLTGLSEVRFWRRP